MAATACQNDIFASVFPQPDFSTPTPEATPEVGVLSSPARPFGGPLAALDVGHEALKLSQSWSVATRFLSVQSGRSSNSKSGYAKAHDSLIYLLSNHTQRVQILDWYMHEIRTHFRQTVLPEFPAWHRQITRAEAATLVEKTVQTAHNAQSIYLHPFEKLESQGYFDQVLDDFCSDVIHRWHTLLQHSVPQDRLQKNLTYLFYALLRRSLSRNPSSAMCLESGVCSCSVDLDERTLHRLTTVGLGGEVGERALATAVYKFLTGPAIERRCFQVDWSGQSSVLQRLQDWVGDCLTPAISQAQLILSGETQPSPAQADIDQQVSISQSALGRSRVRSLFEYVKLWPASKGAIEDIKSYLSRGQAEEKAHVCSSYVEQVRSRLLHAGATTTEIMSIYINTIHIFRHLDPRGVLLDKVAVPIRQYLRTREDTVSVIAVSFLADIDGNGNLASGDSGTICVDIATELDNAESEQMQQDQKTLNWDDLGWTPDPIDAGPDFRSGRSEDVIGYIMGLFEREDFIKEVTNVLAGHLLQTAADSEYAKETRLVELMKSRFDSSKLQAAEVMLKDVRDSRALNKKFAADSRPPPVVETLTPPTPKEIQSAIPDGGITTSTLYEPFARRIDRARFVTALKLVANRRAELWFPKRTRLPPNPARESDTTSAAMRNEVEMNLQIVSSFFWPQMRTETFALPKQLSDRIAAFQSYFERVSAQRKLQLRPALGRVIIELELEDRTVREENVTASRASVLDAFAENGTTFPSEDGQSEDTQATRTPDDLCTRLDMHPDLVYDALAFWSSKRILYQPSENSYAVLERLELLDTIEDAGMAANDIGSPSATVVAGEADGAIISSSALFREQAPTFEIFILNMLKNGGPKEVGGMMGITSMLKMVLPIFTYGEEEARVLLEEMEGKGSVRRNGEVWSAT
ncbi:hypothetical protein K431DRAFT_288587 [Polychaeton citri CBS 116435]|uniref:Cullin family profile domain-containing protein n=1 Tax=Polychaeton citri CBS 116435 TaxID=1314669 RepID=A0A9P4UKE7_9PEZI|nr:hypothetical protein K431DRAFT_288587 [Polychaeton citri CBS 116435]